MRYLAWTCGWGDLSYGWAGEESRLLHEDIVIVAWETWNEPEVSNVQEDVR